MLKRPQGVNLRLAWRQILICYTRKLWDMSALQPKVEIEPFNKCSLVEVKDSRSPKKIFLGLAGQTVYSTIRVKRRQACLAWVDWVSLNNLCLGSAHLIGPVIFKGMHGIYAQRVDMGFARGGHVVEAECSRQRSVSRQRPLLSSPGSHTRFGLTTSPQTSLSCLGMWAKLRQSVTRKLSWSWQ